MKREPEKPIRSRKQLIAFCLGLSKNLLLDILQQAGLDSKRDVLTLERRTQQEGLGFLTKTLPTMGKQIMLALTGKRLSIPQFSTMRGTAIPHFLKGLLSLIFDPEGNVRDDADICAITDVYQFCLTWYKLEVPYDPKIESKVLNKFALVDNGLPKDFTHLGTVDTRLEPNVLASARSLVRDLFRAFNARDIKPKHGPGAVATGEKPHQKMQFKRIYDDAEVLYPATEHYFLNGRHLFDDWDSYWSMDHVTEPVAKVMLVPKDSRGPRLISAEPLEIQFLQQGLGRKLVARIERHPLTRGHVNFSDQSINRRLALEGSKDGKWSTLDLKDASDRVSIALVKEVFRETGLLPFLLALRSKSTELPDGRLVRMGKYAPMGSALCFPVEAVCFWALAVGCIHIVGKVPLRQALASVYVYGDDIIVRAGHEQFLLQYFHYFGLRLNEKKCCYTGLFRESCGCDAYRGQVVTPIKIKSQPLTFLPKKEIRKKVRRVPKGTSTIPPIDGAAFASWVSISNMLFQKCYYRAADYVKKHIESFAGKLPVSERDPHRKLINPWETSSDRHQQSPQETGSPFVISDTAPCWYVRQVAATKADKAVANQDFPRNCTRYNSDLQRTEFRALAVQSITYRSLPMTLWKREDRSDWSELYRHYLAELGTKPYQYAYLRRVKLKRRWTSVAY